MKSPHILASIVIVLSCCSLSLAGDGTDIHTAARAGDLPQVAERLSQQPELLDARAPGGETPLHYAVLGRNTAIVDFLLARGADVSVQDSAGRTPLHFAAMLDNPELINALLAGGADVNVADACGDTPLHLAAIRFRPEALRALLAAGADVNAQNKRGETPLHVLGSAARVRDPEFVQLIESLADLLIEHGADATIIADGIAALQPADDRGIAAPPAGYRDYDDITQMMQDWEDNYPALCQVHDLGVSVQGRHLWALNIGDNIGVEEDEPEFKYVSTMHGDETVGNEMCLYLIDHLLTNYASDPNIAHLVNEIDIWIVPLMNPDGYEAQTRNNANGVDLNRHFPEGSDGEANTTAGKEPEVAVIMDWTFASSFTLSANIHTGALVANYPFDDDNKGSTFSPTPDENLFVYISEEYSYYNSPMWNNNPPFPHGITNGAAWYSISGGMQDWHYRYMGCNEVTLELSNTKAPNYSQIPGFWEDNRESMLAYMKTCLIGVRGLVTDSYNGQPVAATVTVVGRDHEIYTDPDVGDYHRMLLSGSHNLTFEAAGFDSVTLPVTVSSGPATILNVQMDPSARVTYPNGGETLNSNVPIDVTWIGTATAQFHVQYTDNYGQSSSTTDDFERTTLGPDYTTGGDADWYTTTGDAHGGSRSARSGAISHNDVSWMTRTVGGGDLSFWYRVSSEATWDFFNFYVNGDSRIHVSGTSGGWTEYTETLAAGTYELKWEYTKDGSVSHGDDCAYVDDLLLVNNNTTWTDIISLTAPGATSTPWTPVAVGTDYKVRARAYYGGSDYSDWDESDAIFEVAEGAYQTGDLNCDGSINSLDIDPFVLVLTGTPPYDDYYAAYPDCDHTLADCNTDGSLNSLDVDPFVDLLTGV